MVPTRSARRASIVALCVGLLPLAGVGILGEQKRGEEETNKVRVFQLRDLKTDELARILEPILTRHASADGMRRGVAQNNNLAIVPAQPEVIEAVKKVLGTSGDIGRRVDGGGEHDKNEQFLPFPGVDPARMTAPQLRQHIAALTSQTLELSQRVRELEKAQELLIIPLNGD